MIGLPNPYVWAGLFVAGVLSGTYGTHTWYKAQRVDAIEQARKIERSLQRVANQADIRYVDELHAQRERAEANADKFKRALHDKNAELAGCRVDAALLQLLDDAGMSDPSADPSEPRSPGARASAPRDSNCAAELERARDNYANVCAPNAIQLRELQFFTRKLIGDYNCAVGRCSD